MSADEFGPGPFPFKLEEEFLFSGSPTFGDIRAAKRLIAPGYGRKVAVLCGAILVFAILLLAVAVSTRPYSPQAANTIFVVVCVGFPLLLCVPVLIQNLQRRKRAREFNLSKPSCLAPVLVCALEARRQNASGQSSRIASAMKSCSCSTDTMARQLFCSPTVKLAIRISGTRCCT